MIVTQPYCRVVESFSVPKLGAACVLAHSPQLGYVASIDAPNKVELWRVLPEPAKLATMTPPTANLGIASWSTCAASDDAVCVVYAGSYNGDTKVLRYLQVYRNETLSPALLLADISSEWFASEKSRVIWTGTQWLVSTRVKEAGNNAVRFQWVSADGTRIEDVETWTRPEPFFTGASMAQDGHFVYATGLTSNNVDTRTVRRATIDLDTRALVEDALIDSAPMVDTPQVGQHDGIETLWWKDAIYSRLDLGPITVRFPHGGDLQVPQDARLIVTKDVNAALVAQVSAEPTILTPWDGVTPEYRASCASGDGDWLACATVGDTTRFWRLELTDVKPESPPPPPPPKPDTFGEIEPPLPEGTSITMAPYVFAATDFHRDGDHGMAQVKRPEGYYLMKFGHGDAYELWAEDAWGIHHLEDASAFDMNTTYHFTDTRWCRAEMKVGRVHGYTAPTHEIVEFHRDTKAEFNRWGYTREMWLWRAWAKFDCGPDLGVHPVVVMVYDPTGGAHTPPDVTDPTKMRGIELFYFALGLGWVAWEYHHSGRVYQTDTAQFNDYTRLAHTDFYFNGATPITPKPTGCATTPTQVPEVPPMSERNLTTAERATIDAFGANFPPPQYPGPGDAPESWQDVNLRHAPNGWVYKLAQQMAFSHGSGWGQKRRGPGAATSNGTIALKDTGTNFHAYDLLEGASTGRPKLLGGNGSYYYVDDGQEWLSVPPFNHLGDQKPRPGRAPWPAEVRHGVSGFDVAARLQGNDASYYNLTAPLPLNCFVYTTIIHPETHRLGRTFAQGLVQTETLLKRLTADNRRAMFIMVCGPHTANNGPKPTRAEILDMVKQQVALFVRYPKAVLALSLGNELYQQGFEAPEMLDPTLWAEVDQLVPLEFPFCVGQVSEAVVFGPGSFAAMHPDRGKSSADALQILADAQASDGRTVVAREPKRIEAGNFAPTDQASGDLNFVKEELANAKRMNVPYFLHLAAGRGCHVPAMDQVQHDALALLKAEAAVVTPPGPPVPPITPPGSGHPILDVDMGDESKWYPVFVGRRKEIEALAFAWYTKSTGHPPADSDIAHGFYWRSMREWMRWGTLRAALENTWPGGAP